MTDDLYAPAFVIHGKIPERKPPEPPPTPRRQPSDEMLAGNAERVFQHAAARPVFQDGKPTGQWQVSTLRHKDDSTRRWIIVKDRDDADEWCIKVNRIRSKNV